MDEVRGTAKDAIAEVDSSAKGAARDVKKAAVSTPCTDFRCQAALCSVHSRSPSGIQQREVSPRTPLPPRAEGAGLQGPSRIVAVRWVARCGWYPLTRHLLSL